MTGLALPDRKPGDYGAGSERYQIDAAVKMVLDNAFLALNYDLGTFANISGQAPNIGHEVISGRASIDEVARAQERYGHARTSVAKGLDAIRARNIEALVAYRDDFGTRLKAAENEARKYLPAE